MIGAFRSSLFNLVDCSLGGSVRCRPALLLSCFRIQASGISIPLSLLLMLLGLNVNEKKQG